jgi:hypothetical protein
MQAWGISMIVGFFRAKPVKADEEKDWAAAFGRWAMWIVFYYPLVIGIGYVIHRAMP